MTKKLWILTALTIAVIGIVAVFIIPTYKFQYLKLDNCIEITIIEYKSFSDRGIVFTEGHQTHRGLPENGWLYSGLTGFDALFDVTITCDQHELQVNFYEGELKKLGSPQKLQSRLLNGDEYSNLKKANQGRSFRFY